MRQLPITSDIRAHGHWCRLLSALFWLGLVSGDARARALSESRWRVLLEVGALP